MQPNSQEAALVREFWANVPWDREPPEIRRLGMVGAYRYYIRLGTSIVTEARSKQIAQEAAMTPDELAVSRRNDRDELLDVIQGDLPVKTYTRGRPRG